MGRTGPPGHSGTSLTLWMSTQTWQTCRGGRKARNRCVRRLWLSWADIVGRPQGRSSRAVRAGHGQGCTNDRVPQYDGQGSRNLCDDETLSTISHSGCLPNEWRGLTRGGGDPRGRQARRSTPWLNASGWPARRCKQRLSRSTGSRWERDRRGIVAGTGDRTKLATRRIEKISERRFPVTLTQVADEQPG